MDKKEILPLFYRSDRTEQLLFGIVGGSILAGYLMYLKMKGLV